MNCQSLYSAILILVLGFIVVCLLKVERVAIEVAFATVDGRPNEFVMRNDHLCVTNPLGEYNFL